MLVGDGYGLLITGFMANSPFFLGHSILLNHEALLAVCAVTSILSLLIYLAYDRKLRYLILSASAAALAQLTKSSAIAFVPVIGLILCLSIFKKMKQVGFGQSITKILAFDAVVALVYHSLAGMWVCLGRCRRI
jgi:4-amino-4-deoxy-L-arabinose transferase-like glycosyltransferase